MLVVRLRELTFWAFAKNIKKIFKVDDMRTIETWATNWMENTTNGDISKWIRDTTVDNHIFRSNRTFKTKSQEIHLTVYTKKNHINPLKRRYSNCH